MERPGKSQAVGRSRKVHLLGSKKRKPAFLGPRKRGWKDERKNGRQRLRMDEGFLSPHAT
jgi:hypothetical protein